MKLRLAGVMSSLGLTATETQKRIMAAYAQAGYHAFQVPPGEGTTTALLACALLDTMALGTTTMALLPSDREAMEAFEGVKPLVTAPEMVAVLGQPHSLDKHGVTFQNYGRLFVRSARSIAPGRGLSLNTVIFDRADEMSEAVLVDVWPRLAAAGARMLISGTQRRAMFGKAWEVGRIVTHDLTCARPGANG